MFVSVVFVVAPSPKFQKRLVMVPVEVSLSVTSKGSTPLVGFPAKLATGGTIPKRLLYAVVKLSATTTFPIDTPSFGALLLPNCEITKEPTEVGGVPLPIGLF